MFSMKAQENKLLHELPLRQEEHMPFTCNDWYIFMVIHNVASRVTLIWIIFLLAYIFNLYTARSQIWVHAHTALKHIRFEHVYHVVLHVIIAEELKLVLTPCHNYQWGFENPTNASLCYISAAQKHY